MATVQELEELSGHIRRILPKQFLTDMEANPDAGVVQYTWHSRHFVVHPTMQVFELKGKTLMITGASQLMQAALYTRDRNAKVVGAVLESLQTAEENVRMKPEMAFSLLKQVKDTLLNLAGKKVTRNANSPAGTLIR